MEAALAVAFEAFVHTGSSSEYGVKDHAPAEDELPEPNSHNAVGMGPDRPPSAYSTRCWKGIVASVNDVAKRQ